jgi:cytochrome bd-type quinol oxidase subunit 2
MGKTKSYDSVSGMLVGLLISFICIVITLVVYAVYLNDANLNDKPAEKTRRLHIILISGFSISLILGFFIGGSINRYHFCMNNKDLCILENSFSPL